MAGPYITKFTWSYSDFKRGRLSLVQASTDGVASEPAWQSRLVNWWQQWVFVREEQQAAVTNNVGGIKQLPGGGFICLDVGKWLNGTQTFGLVCGNAVAICEYHPGWSAGPPATQVRLQNCRFAGELLRDFLMKAPGVVLSKVLFTWIPPRADRNHLYVILPDTHIPQAASGPLFEKRWMLWYELSRPFGIARNEMPPDNSGAYGQNRDIFGALKSTDALTKFLRVLVQYAQSCDVPDAKMTLIQVGDMYELWAMRPLCFQDTGALGPIMLSDKGLASTVGEWIAGTHFVHQELFAAFDECKKHLTECFFLQGNHDSYLDVDAVVDAANDLLTQAGTEGSQLHKKAVIYGLEYKVKRDFKRTKVWKRDLFFEGNGLHAEHAHNRYDAANHDGSTKGHGPTDLAAKYKWIGQFDSIRRETFVTGGAALYLETRAGVPVYQPFGVYAIGHTHVADLRPVLISHYADNGVQLYFPKSLSNPRAGRQMAKPKSSEIFDGR